MPQVSTFNATVSKPVVTFRSRERALHLTKEGAGFVLLILGVGFGAINTGNNLLYLVLAMCCSFLAVSGILSEITVRKIAVQGTLPPTVYANEFFPLTLKVSNNKKRFASYSFRVALWVERKSAIEIEGDSAFYVFQLPAGEFAEKTFMIRAAKRGSLRIRGFQLSTSFPFGFFHKFKHLPGSLETTVFPEIHAIHPPNLSDPSPEGQGRLRHKGEEVYAVKEYREGDPLSAVHWKSSAKTGDLRVKEFQAGRQQSITIFLNLHDPDTGQPVAGPILEERVSEAASLAYHLIRRGEEVRLKTPDHEISYGNSDPHLETIMQFLAFAGLEEPERKAHLPRKENYLSQ